MYFWILRGSRGSMSVERKRVAEAVNEVCIVLDYAKRKVGASETPDITGSSWQSMNQAIAYFRRECE